MSQVRLQNEHLNSVLEAFILADFAWKLDGEAKEVGLERLKGEDTVIQSTETQLQDDTQIEPFEKQCGFTQVNLYIQSIID